MSTGEEGYLRKAICCAYLQDEQSFTTEFDVKWKKGFKQS